MIRSTTLALALWASSSSLPLSVPISGSGTPEDPTIELNLSAFAQDLDTMTRTLWGEARSQAEAEIATIAHVILNRWQDGRYGSTIRDVLLDPAQFSAWNPSDPNRAGMEALLPTDPSYIRLWTISANALATRLWFGTDLASGARHYVHGVEPSWAQPATPTFQVGDATFFLLTGK